MTRHIPLETGLTHHEQTPIKHPHPSLLKHGNGPRRSDESTTSSLSSGTTSAAESILTPTSATFNLSSTSNPSLGPVIRFKFDDISTDWSLSVTDVDYFQRTTFHAVIPSDAEIGRLGMDGEGEVQILMEKMLGDGEYFLTFSSSASTPTYEDEEDREVDIVYPDSSPPQLDLSQTHFNPHKAKHHAAQHQRLILKFGYLQNRPHHPTGNEIALAIQNEVQTLSGPLSDLQGTVVPRLFGLWRSKDWDWAVVVLEDVIEGFGREELRMDRGLTEGER